MLLSEKRQGRRLEISQVGQDAILRAVAKRAIVTGLVLCLAAGMQPLNAESACPADAKPANLNLTFKDMQGKPFTLSDYNGKVILLDFWATWCIPCLASMPRLEKLARSHPDVAVLTINLDDPARARALFNERGYTMKLLADDGDTSQRYGVTSIPHTVIIDRRGVVREVVRGTGSDLAASVDAVRTSE